ncbi:MAG TPA: hypothetical protein DHV46_10200 [Desulfovibrio piger]|nr:hypothetical protein [Desulfovibrio piger]
MNFKEKFKVLNFIIDWQMI